MGVSFPQRGHSLKLTSFLIPPTHLFSSSSCKIKILRDTSTIVQPTLTIQQKSRWCGPESGKKRNFLVQKQRFFTIKVEVIRTQQFANTLSTGEQIIYIISQKCPLKYTIISLNQKRLSWHNILVPSLLSETQTVDRNQIPFDVNFLEELIGLKGKYMSFCSVDIMT